MTSRRDEDRDLEEAVGTGRKGAMSGLTGIFVPDGSAESDRRLAALAEYNRLVDAGAPFEVRAKVLRDAGIWGPTAPDDD